MTYPLDKVYLAHDPRTGLTHFAQAWERDGSFEKASITHATFCNIEIDRSWSLSDALTHPTCLTCIVEGP